jgi:hypothetical protein
MGRKRCSRGVHQWHREGRSLLLAWCEEAHLQPCGAKRKGCSHEGCTNQAAKGGVCVSHGGKGKRCSHEGCSNGSIKGGVCFSHGANPKRRTCSHEGCTKFSVRGGVCASHGENGKRGEGCANRAGRGGRVRHGAKSLAIASVVVERPPQPTGEISACNLQMNTCSAAAHQSPSPRPSDTTPDFSDDEAIGAWIYETWRRTKMLTGVIAGRGGEIGACNLQMNTCSAAAHRSPSPRPSAPTPDFLDDEAIGAWIYETWRRTNMLK